MSACKRHRCAQVCRHASGTAPPGTATPRVRHSRQPPLTQLHQPRGQAGPGATSTRTRPPRGALRHWPCLSGRWVRLAEVRWLTARPPRRGGARWRRLRTLPYYPRCLIPSRHRLHQRRGQAGPGATSTRTRPPRGALRHRPRLSGRWVRLAEVRWLTARPPRRGGVGVADCPPSRSMTGASTHRATSTASPGRDDRGGLRCGAEGMTPLEERCWWRLRSGCGAGGDFAQVRCWWRGPHLSAEARSNATAAILALSAAPGSPVMPAITVAPSTSAKIWSPSSSEPARARK